MASLKLQSRGYIKNLQGFNLFFSFSFLQPADKKKFPYGGMNSNRPVTPPRGGNQKKGKK